MNIDELNELWAEHENRISGLESAQLYSDVIPGIWERLDKLEALLKEHPPTPLQLKQAKYTAQQALGIAKSTRTLIQEHVNSSKN